MSSCAIAGLNLTPPSKSTVKNEEYKAITMNIRDHSRISFNQFYGNTYYGNVFVLPQIVFFILGINYRNITVIVTGTVSEIVLP